MRKWQFLLELLLHHTPMTDSLHLCFPLGRSGRLPLAACCFYLPWSQFAKDRIVLGNVSWQFGHSLFILGHFFLLNVGLVLDMKWVGVAKFFGPTHCNTIFVFSLCTFIYLFLKLFWVWHHRRSRYLFFFFFL